MHILLVAATRAELPASLPTAVTPLVAGVGMVATAIQTARELAARRYDLALNVGVCGSFRPHLAPGTVVHVVDDRLAELGAQDGDAFLSLKDLQLPGDDCFVNANPPALPALATLPTVSGITVNTVHGHAGAIARIVERCDPDVESMEGAAFMSACLTAGVPFAQVRAVSNIVERRNREAWKMGEAIAALHAATLAIVGAASA
ncbi:MAG: futalosine hydrolase [Vicinamibacterales bacterium]